MKIQPYLLFLYGSFLIFLYFLGFKSYNNNFHNNIIFILLPAIFFVERSIRLLKDNVEEEKFLHEMVDNILLSFIFIAFVFIFIILNIGRYEYVYTICNISFGLGYFIIGLIIKNKLISIIGSVAVILSITILILSYKHITLFTFINFSKYLGITVLGIGSYILAIYYLKEANTK